MARSLAKDLDLTLVDNYVQRLQRKTDLALGPWSSYSEHFMVACDRLAEEYKAGFNKRVTVTTIVDTVVYAAIKADVTIGNTTEERNAAYTSARSAMLGLGLLYGETWDYDVSFWLPYNNDQREQFRDTWQFSLDAAYPAVIESFAVPYVVRVDGNTHQERITFINEVINKAKNAEEAPQT